jgi:hypothetical protein
MLQPHHIAQENYPRKSRKKTNLSRASRIGRLPQVRLAPRMRQIRYVQWHPDFSDLPPVRTAT